MVGIDWYECVQCVTNQFFIATMYIHWFWNVQLLLLGECAIYAIYYQHLDECLLDDRCIQYFWCQGITI